MEHKWKVLLRVHLASRADEPRTCQAGVNCFPSSPIDSFGMLWSIIISSISSRIWLNYQTWTGSSSGLDRGLLLGPVTKNMGDWSIFKYAGRSVGPQQGCFPLSPLITRLLLLLLFIKINATVPWLCLNISFLKDVLCKPVSPLMNHVCVA